MRAIVRTLLWLVMVAAMPVRADSATDNLRRLLSAIDTLHGRFEQLVIDPSGSRLQQSEGELWLKRPGLFRWRTEDPFAQLLVGDGEWIWLYDEDLMQVTRQKQADRISEVPALLLSGDTARLEERFRVSGPEAGDQGVWTLEPLARDAAFAFIRLYFEAGQPTEVQLEDSLGQRTSIAFLNLELNRPLDAGLFRFEVPDGVDLISE